MHLYSFCKQAYYKSVDDDVYFQCTLETTFFSILLIDEMCLLTCGSVAEPGPLGTSADRLRLSRNPDVLIRQQSTRIGLQIRPETALNGEITQHRLAAPVAETDAEPQRVVETPATVVGHVAALRLDEAALVPTTERASERPLAAALERGARLRRLTRLDHILTRAGVLTRTVYAVHLYTPQKHLRDSACFEHRMCSRNYRMCSRPYTSF